MPRASEYRVAAQSFRTRRDRLAEAARADRSAPTLAAAGPVAERSHGSVLRLRRLFLWASGEFAELAAVCDRRAEVCDAYARDVAVYERLDRWQRMSVARPHRPAEWVEA